MRPAFKIALPIAAVVVILDQLTKFWIQHNVLLYTSKTVIPGFFNIVHVLNRGAAFGFLNRPDISWQTYLFFGATALAVVLILHLLRAAGQGDTVLIIGLGFILGGAVGNLIDRVRLGKVIDFLDFYIDNLHWPAFNVADIAITLGSLTLVAAFFFMRGARPKSGDDA